MTTVRGMGTLAAKYWWVFLVRGILLVLLGIAMLAWPTQPCWSSSCCSPRTCSSTAS